VQRLSGSDFRRLAETDFFRRAVAGVGNTGLFKQFAKIQTGFIDRRYSKTGRSIKICAPETTPNASDSLFIFLSL
jgi:hypothetical protein